MNLKVCMETALPPGHYNVSFNTFPSCKKERYYFVCPNSKTIMTPCANCFNTGVEFTDLKYSKLEHDDEYTTNIVEIQGTRLHGYILQESLSPYDFHCHSGS